MNKVSTREKVNVINLTIAGIHIAIIFHRCDNSYLRHKLFNDIKNQYKGFINFDSNIKPKSKIEIVNKFSQTLNINEKTGEYFYKFAHKNSKGYTIPYHTGIYQFNYILQSIIVWKLTNIGGFILHASSTLVDNKSILFLGESGMGKSTARKLLSTTYKAFSDEYIIVRKVKSHYLSFQTPFLEKRYKVNKTYMGTEMRAIYFLQRDKKQFINLITDKLLIYELLIKQNVTEQRLINISLRNIHMFVCNFSRFGYLSFNKNKKSILKLLSGSPIES